MFEAHPLALRAGLTDRGFRADDSDRGPVRKIGWFCNGGTAERSLCSHRIARSKEDLELLLRRPDELNPGEVRLPPIWEGAFRRLASLVSGLARENLLGISVYGLALAEEHDQQAVIAQSVIVLERVDLPLLRRLGEHGAELGRRRIGAPLVMTPQHISGSLDTFPLELLEIAQRRATVAGDDHFAGLEFHEEHVRLQCEREFKRVKMRLRQGLVALAGQEEALAELQLDVGRHLMRTMRGLSWLKGERHYLNEAQVVARCAELTGRRLHGVMAALRPGGEHGWAEFTALYDDAEAMAAMSNAE